MKRLISFSIAMIAFFASYAQNHSDSAKVVFKRSSSRFDPALGDNRAAMSAFIEVIRDNRNDIDSVVVRGCASPDGSVDVNRRLSVSRCDTIASYIIRNTQVNPQIVKTVPEGVAWNELTYLVENNSAVPAQKEVLNILRNTPVWIFDKNNRIIDGRKRQLMRLRGGRPYNWLLANIFPQLRNAVMISIYGKFDNASDEDSSDGSTEEEVIIVMEEDDRKVLTDSVGDPLVCRYEDSIDTPATPSPSLSEGNGQKSKPFHRFAIKTNLLYYAILMPNLELEGMINKNWSVALEGNIAWWSNGDQTRTYQVATVSPEVKYWINPRDPWHGMFAGVFAGGGLYDLENKGKGYQGSGAFVGASFGYMWPISRNFSLEAAIGVGYMYSRYKEYIPDDGHFVYMRTKNLNYFGPLKLKFSIVWRLADSNKSK